MKRRGVRDKCKMQIRKAPNEPVHVEHKIAACVQFFVGIC